MAVAWGVREGADVGLSVGRIVGVGVEVGVGVAESVGVTVGRLVRVGRSVAVRVVRVGRGVRVGAAVPTVSVPTSPLAGRVGEAAGGAAPDPEGTSSTSIRGGPPSTHPWEQSAPPN